MYTKLLEFVIKIHYSNNMDRLTTNQKIGKKIRTLRNEKGLTQVQLADEISIHPKRLSNIENGEKPVSILILENLSKFFDVPLYYFLDFTDTIISEDDSSLINTAILMLKSADPETRKKLCKTINIFTKK